MKTCIKCNRSFDVDDANFCPYCGARTNGIVIVVGAGDDMDKVHSHFAGIMGQQPSVHVYVTPSEMIPDPIILKLTHTPVIAPAKSGKEQRRERRAQKRKSKKQ